MLDFVSSTEQMGKPTAADLKLGLATAPVLFACEKVSPGSGTGISHGPTSSLQWQQAHCTALQSISQIAACLHGSLFAVITSCLHTSVCICAFPPIAVWLMLILLAMISYLVCGIPSIAFERRFWFRINSNWVVYYATRDKPVRAVRTKRYSERQRQVAAAQWD